MNPKPIFNLFSPKGTAQAVAHQGASILIISSVALSLVALTIYMQIKPANLPVVVVVPHQVEAGGQQRIEALPNIDPADRKFFSPGYGLAAFSNIPESDADQDMGLMEFFTVPDEISR